ncbi:hypothetical protein BHM03_00004545 [Ensete ventricosum]|nr:hypothetical protein BHM03_00004545 [Ensete ventricosum]
MAVEVQQDAKNATLIPSVTIIADSKLGVFSIGDRPPWNSIGNSCGFYAWGDLYRGSTSLELYKGSSLLGFLYKV